MNVDKVDIQGLVAGYSIETTPAAAREIDDFSRYLTPKTRVYVTFLPGSRIENTLETCALLKTQGMAPVPHIALRNFESKKQLEESFAFLEKLGVEELLLLAGGANKAKGPFACVEDLLEDGLLSQFGFKNLGFAGHPEGSPDISPYEVRRAVSIKYRYLQKNHLHGHLVSQFCFDAKPIIQWERQLRSDGTTIPLHIGLPGLASIRTLLRHAKSCGVGPSMLFLTKNGRNLRHLLSVSKPDHLIHALALANKALHGRSLIIKLHFFPLGSFVRTVSWLRAIEEGLFTLRDDGFDVESF